MASCYSAVCLETGEVEWIELEGNSKLGHFGRLPYPTGGTIQLEERYPGSLRVIWDNAPANRGEALMDYLKTPRPGRRLENLQGYSPDFNVDEAIRGRAREEATGNQCLGTKSSVQQRVGSFPASLSSRRDAVKRRGRTVLRSGPGHS